MYLYPPQSSDVWPGFAHCKLASTLTTAPLASLHDYLASHVPEVNTATSLIWPVYTVSGTHYSFDFLQQLKTAG